MILIRIFINKTVKFTEDRSNVKKSWRRCWRRCSWHWTRFHMINVTLLDLCSKLARKVRRQDWGEWWATNACALMLKLGRLNIWAEKLRQLLDQQNDDACTWGKGVDTGQNSTIQHVKHCLALLLLFWRSSSRMALRKVDSSWSTMCARRSAAVPKLTQRFVATQLERTSI